MHHQDRPFTGCVDLGDFTGDGCEQFKIDAPMCASTRDCDGGVCCYQSNLDLLSCQTAAACPGDGTDTYQVCGSDQGCRSANLGTCAGASGNPLDGGTAGVCTP